MTLTIYDQLEQGGTEWLQARAGILTASTIGQLITAKTIKPAMNDRSRGLCQTLIAERITGHVEPVHPASGAPPMHTSNTRSGTPSVPPDETRRTDDHRSPPRRGGPPV